MRAAATVGEDGKGKNGLLGYLVKQARTRPDLFLPMLVKVMLLQSKSKPEPVDQSNTYETADDLMQAFLDRRVPIELWPPFLRAAYEKKAQGRG